MGKKKSEKPGGKVKTKEKLTIEHSTDIGVIP
jgi:hypothetical protein